VLNGLAGVRVAFDTEPGNEPDRLTDRLAERVPVIPAHRGNCRCWHRHHQMRGISLAVRLA
jgi:hypothetical protein